MARLYLCLPISDPAAPFPVYSLYLDASGTHGASPVYILAGIALHEQDAHHMQQRFAGPLSKLPGSPDPRDYELHATEIVTPRAGTNWHGVSPQARFDILRAAFHVLATYQCVDGDKSPAFFGAVVERARYHDYEQRAWDEVLHRFDEMLTRRGVEAGEPHERGIVIHDRHATERTVQDWAERWRMLESRIGTLTHLADVPFFADSKASRLLQAADFIAYALWRYYGPPADSRAITDLWSHFDQADGKMHGLIHASSGFHDGTCICPLCASRVAP